MATVRITGLPAPLSLPANPTRQVADSYPGWPCRRCLCDATVGDVMLLVFYDPWLVDSPYRQSGPVFVHEQNCQPWQGLGLPEQQTRRILSLRAIDHAGLQRIGDVVPGAAALDRLDHVLADPDIAYVHLHHAGPGCFAARVDRITKRCTQLLSK